MCIRIQPQSNKKKKIESRMRYKEKRKMEISGKMDTAERSPMTITRCPKCHLTINGSMRRRNSNLSDGLDRNGIWDREDLCQNFPVEGPDGLAKKKRMMERQVQSAG